MVKSGPVDPVFITKIPHEYKKTYGIILDKYFFISQHFGDPKFPEFPTLQHIKNAELVFLKKLVGPKQLASPNVFKEFPVVES